MAKPRFPKSPSDVPFKVWLELVKQPHCSNFGFECSALCQPVDADGYYNVHVHHIIPRARGGLSTLDNLRPICACRNLETGPRIDPDYGRSYYFDQSINTDKLRQHQLEKAYAIPMRTHQDLFLNNYSVILDNKMLLFVWLMGAGKTIGVCAFLFAINQLRAPFRARRIRRVLWMVHHRALVNLLAGELRNELTGFGIIDNAPDVYAPDDTDGIFARPQADIVCIPPNRLWPAEGRKLSEEDRHRFLSSFDAIVVDEAHFAVDRYLETIKAAPQALKIAITATPIDGDEDKLTLLSETREGKYKKHFVVISTYGYQDGWNAGIYKELLSFEGGRAAQRYLAIEGGTAEIAEGETYWEETNTNNPLNTPRTNAISVTAAEKAAQQDRLNGGPNLIMLRVDSIQKARFLAAAINEDRDLAKYGRAIAVYAGVTGHARLSHENHPWMQVHRDGQFHGTLFLICVDMGQIGVNNRFCSIIVWRDVPSSLIELIQRIGRALRTMQTEDRTKEHVILIWRDRARKNFEKILKEALEYILDLPDTIAKKFITLNDLQRPAEIIPEAPEANLPTRDLIKLMDLAGAMPKASTEEIIAMLPEPGTTLSEGKIDAATKFIKEVIRPPKDDEDAIRNSRNRRIRMLGAVPPDADDNTPLHPGKKLPLPVISYVRDEAPPDNYTMDKLVEALEQFPEFQTDKAHWKSLLKNENGDGFFTRLVSGRLKARYLIAYKAPGLIWEISDITTGRRNGKAPPKGYTPPRTIAAEFVEKYLLPVGFPERERTTISLASKCVNAAAGDLFRLKPLSPRDNQTVAQYHVHIVDALLESRNQQLILRRALYILLKLVPDKVPYILSQFADVLGNIP